MQGVNMSFYDLRLNDLAAFNTAFEQESISKAAEMLYTTRQSVARSIDRVESMTGIQLFERTPMGIIPNIQGSRVYEISKTVVNEARKFDRVGISGNETITVGVMGKYQTGCLIEDLLEEYSEEKENLKIEVSQHDWPGILGKVEKHELMFAYVGLVDEYIPKTLETAAMRKNCLYAIAAKEEAAFCGGRFPAQLLDGKNILLHSRYNIQLGILRRYAEENGIKLRSCQTTSDIFLIAECLEKPD